MRRTAQSVFFLIVAILLPAAVQAQTQPSRTVELAVAYWQPAVSLRTSSDAGGVPGTPIDLTSDLGATSRGFPIVTFAVRPARRHRVELEYIPIRYDSTTTLARPIVFNGTRYAAGETIASTLSWNAINAVYEYAFMGRSRTSLSAVIEWKSTVVEQRLTGPSGDQSRRTNVPAPAIGLAVRHALSPRVVLDGKASGFWVPDSQNGHYGGRYFDVDAGATIALTRNLSARGGVRWLDIRHLGESDSARGSLPGPYAGIIVSR